MTCTTANPPPRLPKAGLTPFSTQSANARAVGQSTVMGRVSWTPCTAVTLTGFRIEQPANLPRTGSARSPVIWRELQSLLPPNSPVFFDWGTGRIEATLGDCGRLNWLACGRATGRKDRLTPGASCRKIAADGREISPVGRAKGQGERSGAACAKTAGANKTHARNASAARFILCLPARNWAHRCPAPLR